MRRTFWLARLLALATAAYLIFTWLRLGGIDQPFVAIGVATAALLVGTLRRPRRNRMKWLLPSSVAIYALGILISLALHLRLGLAAAERTVPAAFLIFGLILSLRSIYQVTTPDRQGLPNYFDSPTRRPSSSSRPDKRTERKS